MEPQPSQDEQQLRLLAIFHYVLGGLMALGACFPIIHLAVGLSMMSGRFGPPRPGEAPPGLIGAIFVGIGAGAILLGWTMALCILFAGRSLAQRRRYVFCMVMAGLMTVTCIPLGTGLGVITMIVLQRPSVKQAFGTRITFVGD